MTVRFIVGSPSLPMADQMFDLEKTQRSRYRQQRGTAVVFVAGEFEGSPKSGRSIPARAQTMAGLLRQSKVDAQDVISIKGEDHGTVKPAIISRGFGWLEAKWAKSAKADVPRQTRAPQNPSRGQAQAGIGSRSATSASASPAPPSGELKQEEEQKH